MVAVKKLCLVVLLGCVMLTAGCQNDPCRDGHTWVEATCAQPKTCSVCGAEEGAPLEHTVSQWATVTEATCQGEGKEQGTCTLCGETIERSLPKLAHTAGEWEVTREATESLSGLRALKCAVCGETMEEQTFTLSPEEIRTQYISKCSSYSYGEIARNPDAYIGKYAALTGEVIQVIEDGTDYTLRVNITKGTYTWSDTILVTYTQKDSQEPRILEDDIINLYGVLGGTHTYETVMGAQLTVPIMDAEYIDII
jgi:hypothetical protein